MITRTQFFCDYPKLAPGTARLCPESGGQMPVPGLCRALHEKIAGADKHFLVSRAQQSAPRFPGPRVEASIRPAADFRHHPIRLSATCFAESALPAPHSVPRAGQRIFPSARATGDRDEAAERAPILSPSSPAPPLLFPCSAGFDPDNGRARPSANPSCCLDRPVAPRRSPWRPPIPSLVVTQWNWAHGIHQTIIPRVKRAADAIHPPPQKSEKSAAKKKTTTAAAESARRSITPCPGLYGWNPDAKRVSPRFKEIAKWAQWTEPSPRASSKGPFCNVSAGSALFDRTRKCLPPR